MEFRFSRRIDSIQPSPIRELFKVIQRPGMISFAGGLPDPAIFPVHEFAECAEVLQRDGKIVLQYGASEGYGPLVEAVQGMMAAGMGLDVPADRLLITSGSQQAADLLARALVDPGDPVVVEAPPYPGPVHTFRNVGARCAAVPCDGDGMQVERLPEVLRRAEAETGRRVRLVYTIPDFSNPSGACMSTARRRELLRLAEQHDLVIFEDDPYGRLRYKGEPRPTLMELSGGSPHVLYASSFSKVLAPGVRVAWAAGASELIRTMVLLRQGEDLCTPVVTQALVAEYCRLGHLERHLARIIDHYRAKRDAMQQQLVARLPEGVARWHEPEGGFFFWLELAGHDSDALFQQCLERSVAFLPGTAFYPGAAEQVGDVQQGGRFARLCFTFADDAQIDEGCRRLAAALA